MNTQLPSFELPPDTGQFVLSCKHTLIPLTVSAVVIFNVPPIPEPNVSALVSKEVPVAILNERRPVVVAFTPVAFVNVSPDNDELPVTLNVPVAEMFDAVRPPNNVTLDVAKAPRLVTEAKVSASDATLGQPTPFCKQIPCPATVAEANWAKLAFNVEPVAVVNESNPVEARFVAVVF